MNIDDIADDITDDSPNMDLTSIMVKTQYVYFIAADPYNGAVKIGKANDCDIRLKQLQTGTHLDLKIYHKLAVPNAFVLEKQLHRQYASYRLRGEWFSFTREELDRAISLAELEVAGPESLRPVDNTTRLDAELRAMMIQIQELSLVVRAQGVKIQEILTLLHRMEPKHIDNPQVVQPIVVEHVVDNDLIAEFLADETEPTPKGSIFSRPLHNKYLEWCRGRNIVKPKGPRAFSIDMARRYRKEVVTAGSRFLGIAFKVPEQPVMDV